MSVYILNSEPEATTAADADELHLYDASSGAVKKVGADTLRSYMNTGVVNLTAATLSGTVLAHAGQTVTVNKADGATITLPAATGTGGRFKFYVGTTITSVGLIIQVASASDIMAGGAWVMADGGDTVVAFETAADSDTITMNGTTTGGIVGDSIELIDVASGVWWVRVMASATGTEVTPFSAAVS